MFACIFSQRVLASLCRTAVLFLALVAVQTHASGTNGASDGLVTPVCTLTANPKVISAGSTSVLTVTCSPAATSYVWTGALATTDSSSLVVSPSGPANYSVQGVNAAGLSSPAFAAVYVCNSPPVTPTSGLSVVAEHSSALFTGSIGDDVFLGMSGVNQVVYRCNAQDFTMTRTPGGWKIASKAEGIDELTHIERVEFADKTVALDIGGNAGMAYRLYRAAFNRAPDTEGLRYWISALDRGADLQDVSAAFLASAEFQVLYGENPSNTEFVSMLYRNVLHRLPDEDGSSFWQSLLKSGLASTSDVLVQFSESPENQAQVLSLIMNGIDLGSAHSSVARRWMEVALSAIRNDNARPPVHARNLFHLSAAMWDAWSAGDVGAKPYLLGVASAVDACPAPVFSNGSTTAAHREEAISYGAYRFLLHRYAQSPGFAKTESLANALMRDLGFDPEISTLNMSLGSPADLGNYIAQCYIRYGLQDGSNQAGNYANRFYKAVNIALIPRSAGDPFISNLDRWQPLDLLSFEDQAGFGVNGGGTVFVGAEWGQVLPFAMGPDQRAVFQRGGASYPVYYDPGPPPSIYTEGKAAYQQSFAMVAKWSSHLDPRDGVLIDISPGAIGNLGDIPTGYSNQFALYNERQGGDASKGRRLNSVTQQPYTPQIVPRGDYARVLAEFWADGPNSETPPGHWFLLLNRVADSPGFQRKLQGAGRTMDPLEWDVKSYFALGGAMHDAAIAAWGIKGWYDSVRPISAIRAMADLGQSTDAKLPHYDPKGLPLEPGFIELVMPGDPIAAFGASPDYHLYKIKVKSWRGPLAVANAATDVAGVDSQVRHFLNVSG